MAITASHLRQHVYRVLDKVAETGEPVEIIRRGKRLRIVAADPPAKLDRLERRPGYLRVTPEALVHLDWSDEWRP